MTNRTEQFFHQYASDFNAIYGTEGGPVARFVNHFFRKSMRERFVRTLGACQPIEGRTVLDVGCGPGHYSVSLARLGAARVLGVDVAEGMLDIAREHAKAEGVAEACEFRRLDFFGDKIDETFDYVVVMGFMDYVEDAPTVVRKIMSLTRGRAMFSFPVAGGFLAWQRELRYRSRCPLYLYDREKVLAAFAGIECQVDVTQISRDFFVTASPKD